MTVEGLQRSQDMLIRVVTQSGSRISAKPLLQSQHYARFPPFRCRSSVAVSPFPLAVAVAA